MEDIIKVLIDCENIEQAETVDEYVGELGYSSIIDKVEKNKFVVIVFFKTKINAKELVKRIKILDIAFDYEFQYKIENIDENWLVNSQKSFDAIETEKHFIYQTFFEGKINNDKVNIIINPGQAFGTGSHETTRCCIRLIEYLIEKKYMQNFKSSIDLGTGSGILAISLLKNNENLSVDISDIDDVAIEVCDYNFNLNNVKYNKAYVSNGFDEIEYKKYDLIVSNILYKPLLEIAPDVKNYINDNGMIILSGILTSQIEGLVNQYSKFGFKLLKQIEAGEWAAILLEHE